MGLGVIKLKDLREKVKDERTFLKKIEVAIPGFRGYRKREDLRIADSMLRDYIANVIKDTEKYIKEVREYLSENMALEEMNSIRKIINKLSAMEKRIRHAEQGYMGLVSDYRVDTQQLNNLYEFDLKLIEKSQNLLSLAKEMLNNDDINAIHYKLISFSSELNEIEDTFERRRNEMLEVFG